MAGNAKNIIKFALLTLCIFFAAACATSFDAKGRYHVVQSGESIWKIARAYRVSVQDLAELNNISDGAKMTAGTKLYLPDRPKRSSFKKLPKKEREKAMYDSPIEYDRSKFIWPVNGTVTSQFGIRNGRRHDGIDISAPSGTPIYAANGGKVVFSSRMSGYGNTVILRHEDKFFSIYSHNSKNLAKKGKSVKKGELIAYIGSTGRSTGPHLHFEIRHGQKARNPLFFLPVSKGEQVKKPAKRSKRR